MLFGEVNSTECEWMENFYTDQWYWKTRHDLSIIPLTTYLISIVCLTDITWFMYETHHVVFWVSTYLRNYRFMIAGWPNPSTTCFAVFYILYLAPLWMGLVSCRVKYVESQFIVKWITRESKHLRWSQKYTWMSIIFMPFLVKILNSVDWWSI